LPSWLAFLAISWSIVATRTLIYPVNKVGTKGHCTHCWAWDPQFCPPH
jgi:hypothetical protein